MAVRVAPAAAVAAGRSPTTSTLALARMVPCTFVASHWYTAVWFGCRLVKLTSRGETTSPANGLSVRGQRAVVWPSAAGEGLTRPALDATHGVYL